MSHTWPERTSYFCLIIEDLFFNKGKYDIRMIALLLLLFINKEKQIN
jgi:hypothetical protein